MAATIWKFPLAPMANEVRVPMPKGAVILTAAAINDDPFVWAIVDPDAPIIERELSIRGTGHDLGTVGGYIGTFVLYGGSLVFHVFDAVSATAGEAF